MEDKQDYYEFLLSNEFGPLVKGESYDLYLGNRRMASHRFKFHIKIFGWTICFFRDPVEDFCNAFRKDIRRL